MGRFERCRCNLNSCLSPQRRGPNRIKAAQMKKQQRDRCSSTAFISWKYNISFRRTAPGGIPSSGTICFKSLVPIRGTGAAASLRRAVVYGFPAAARRATGGLNIYPPLCSGYCGLPVITSSSSLSIVFLSAQPLCADMLHVFSEKLSNQK